MSNKKTQLKKSDIVYHLLKGWRIILLFTVLGLIIGIVVIGAGYIRGEMSKEYRIKSSVVVAALNEKDQFSSNTNFLEISSSILYGLNEYIPGKSVIS